MAVLSDKQFLWVAGGAVVVVVALGWLAKQKAAEVVKHVDPTDPENIANTVHEYWWEKLTGKKGVGVWLADMINPPPPHIDELNEQIINGPRYD